MLPARWSKLNPQDTDVSDKYTFFGIAKLFLTDVTIDLEEEGC